MNQEIAFQNKFISNKLLLIITLSVSYLCSSCTSEPQQNDSNSHSTEEKITMKESTPIVELDSNGLVKDSVKIAAEAFLLERLNNPASYQFASIETTNDVFTQRRNLEYRIEFFSKPSYSHPNGQPDIAREVSDLLSSLGGSADDVSCYVYRYNFRATNAMGGLVLTNSLLYISPNYRVVNIALTDGQRYETTCNELQAYRDIILSRMD